MAATQELPEQRKQPLVRAIALEGSRRVPFVPLGDALAAQALGADA